VSSGGFDGFFGFPAIRMGAGMRIAVERGEVGDHFVKDARVCWSGGLGVEVNGPSASIENSGLVY